MKCNVYSAALFGILFIFAGCPTDEYADDDPTGDDDDIGDDDIGDDDIGDDDIGDDDIGDDDIGDDDAGDDDVGDDDDAAFGPFTDSYLGKQHSAGSSCNEDEDILYYTPCDVDAGACTGSYPVLFWLQGTCMPHDAAVVHEILQAAARQGFVAVSPQFFNGGHDGPPDGIAPPDWCVGDEQGEFCDCELNPLTYTGLTQVAARGKADCIFDPQAPAPAVGPICDLPFADCSAMVASGGSQGANVAVRGAEYGPVAVAAYALPFAWSDLCHDNRTWLADEDLLEIHGGHDVVATPSGDDGFIEYLSGTVFDGAANPELDCTQQCTEPSPGNYPTCDCRASNAPQSGWYLVGADEVVDGDPDHAFVCHDHESEPYMGSCSSLDPGFLNTSEPDTEQPWSWPNALEFLMSRARP